MNNVYLIPCSAGKKEGLLPAKEMYSSPLFSKMKEYVGNNKWYILSAKYGLLHPDTIIATYNLSLLQLKQAERLKWSNLVIGQIVGEISEETPLVFFTGKLYHEILLARLVNYKIEIPLAGLGIGQRLRWLNENLSSRNRRKTRTGNR